MVDNSAIEGEVLDRQRAVVDRAAAWVCFRQAPIEPCGGGRGRAYGGSLTAICPAVDRRAAIRLAQACDERSPGSGRHWCLSHACRSHSERWGDAACACGTF